MSDTVRREVRLHQTDPVISRIVLVSGVDGAGFLSIATKTPNDMFGWYVSPIGDFDADGFEDLAVCAPASLIADGLGPNDPGGPIPAWRGRAELISGATGAELMTIFNPEATFDSIFGLGAAPIPDQDADGMPDLLVGGMRIVPAPTTVNPNATNVELRWWVMSVATGEPIRMGVGPVGAVGCEFLHPGPPQETIEQYWIGNEAAGTRDILPGIAGDMDGDGDVDAGDAAALIGEWTSGTGTGHFGDLNGDGVVDSADLSILLAQMGLPPDIAGALGGVDVVAAYREIDLKNFHNGGNAGPMPCMYEPGGCTWDFWNTNLDLGPPDEGGGGGCPGCPNWPPPCTGPCCNNPDPCCVNPCGCNPCGCYGCNWAGCWAPECGGNQNCANCNNAAECDDDGDGWVNAVDCDSACYEYGYGTDYCDCDNEWGFGSRPSNIYVGVHQPFNFQALFGGMYLNLRWEIESGSELLETVSPLNDRVFFFATAGAAPGTVQIRCHYERHGKVCERVFTVHIVEYEPVTIRYATFIPCEIVALPPEWAGGGGVLPPYFGGDDRVAANGLASIFSATSLRYRTGHQVTIRVSDHYVNPPALLDNEVPPFGVTMAFDFPAVVAAPSSTCQWRSVAGPYATTQTVRTDANHRIEFARLMHNGIRLKFVVNAGDPMVPLACTIDSHIQFLLIQTIDSDTGDQHSRVEISGTHDEYPAHEIYVGKDGMFPGLAPRYTFDPQSAANPPGVLHLCLLEDQQVGNPGIIVVLIDH